MATDTIVKIRRNPYVGFEVEVRANGEITRRSFLNSHDLTTALVGECVDDQTIEAACDQYERLTFDDPPPVAEAVTDFVSSCDCDACRLGINAEKIAELESDVRTLYRRVGFVLLAIGVAVWLF